ncbi:MAG: amidohydrolase family protein [Candidatus Acidiferrum sp.]
MRIPIASLMKMKRVLWLVTVAVILAIPTVGPILGAPTGFAVAHVTVIDSTTNTARPDQTVVVSNGRIAEVGPSSRVKPPKDAQIIDGHGKFLIPGLWDMHVHIAGLNADPAWSKQVLLPLLIANGITGVRDMGGDLDVLLAWKHDVENGTVVGPHIVAAGPFLASEKGKTPEQYPVPNAEAGRAAVRELKKRNADFIKIISVPSADVFFAIADESKKQSIPFAGHLPFQISAIEASNAGMRSIEHLLYSGFSLSFSSNEQQLRGQLVEAESKGDSVAWEQIAHRSDATYSQEKAAQLFATLKRNGTWVTPTLASLDITSHPDDWSADDPQLAYVPPALAEQWRASMRDASMKERAAWLARQSTNDWRLTGELHKAGISLLAGSDSLDPFVFTGESLHRELVELVRAGLTPGEVLAVATFGAARFLGREKEFGTIESGKIADLVLLDRSPLENIANTQSVAGVAYGGAYLDRVALDKLLAQARAAAAAVSAASR